MSAREASERENDAIAWPSLLLRRAGGERPTNSALLSVQRCLKPRRMRTGHSAAAVRARVRARVRVCVAVTHTALIAVRRSEQVVTGHLASRPGAVDNRDRRSYKFPDG